MPRTDRRRRPRVRDTRKRPASGCTLCVRYPCGSEVTVPVGSEREAKILSSDMEWKYAQTRAYKQDRNRTLPTYSIVR